MVIPVPETGVIGRVTSVQSTTIRVSLDVGAKGFTKAGPDGLNTVGVVNSYITVPAGAHRVVAIVAGVYISRRIEKHALSQEQAAIHAKLQLCLNLTGEVAA